MKRKNLYLTLIIIGILLANAIIVYADGGSDKEKLNNTNKQLTALEKEINKKEKQKKDVNKEIERLDLQIDKTSQELQIVENQLKNLNNKIVITKAELEEAEKSIVDKNTTFNSRLRVMYKNGTVGYLEVLLSSKDMKDFLARIDMVQSIIDQDVELLKFMKEQRETILDKKTELEAQQGSVVAAKRNIEQKKQDLIVATRSKEVFMRDLQKDIKEAEKQYDELNDLAKKIEEQIRRKQSSGKYEGGKLQWPVTGYTRISSPFGYRIHPIFKTKKMHTGIDIPAPTGTPVKAAGQGTIQFAGWLGGYGQAIWIDHGGGITTLYAHNSKLLVKEGDKVKQGQTISKVGSTGNSTGPHVHFEVRRNGKYEDPIPWVKGK